MPDPLPENQEIHYQCQRCTNCCKWPGFVAVSDQDITRIAEFLDQSESDFISNHTRLRPQRNGLALLCRPDGECAFLDGRDCAIQPVKPRQCSGFPNTWNFPGWQKVCEAKPIALELAPAGAQPYRELKA